MSATIRRRIMLQMDTSENLLLADSTLYAHAVEADTYSSDPENFNRKESRPDVAEHFYTPRYIEAQQWQSGLGNWQMSEKIFNCNSLQARIVSVGDRQWRPREIDGRTEGESLGNRNIHTASHVERGRKESGG